LCRGDEGCTQGTLFPVTLEELIPDDHVCRVIDVFVGRLDMAGLGFERPEAAETGRPGYDPRDLLKLYLYGYLMDSGERKRKLAWEWPPTIQKDCETFSEGAD
jgi:transposase